MLAKLTFFVLLALAIWVVLFPFTVPRILKRLGRRLGGLGRAGKELWTGESVPASPLARYEAEAGRTVEEKILATHPLPSDPRLESWVAGVGARVAAGGLRREIAYRFRVIESSEPNAYSVPGGAVIVTRPLVDLCGGDQNQLAGVLAHEVAHIDRRHAVRHLAASAVARYSRRILSLGRGGLLSQAVGALENLMERGYARQEELEADQIAMHLSARAGFDPRAYPHFLRSVLERRLEAQGCFRTHPPIPERLRALGA